MEALLEIEKIKQLKARYFRALDTNDWALFAATLSQDCIGSYSDGDLSFDGRDAIVTFMRDNLSGDKILTLHHGHHPEIDIVDATAATGIWYLEDTVLALEAGIRIYGGAIYADEYRKVDGQWCICKTGYKRTFECSEPLDAQHSVLKNMFRDI
ncbi:MAG: nuclear transport factor 2 family protein [Halioglobus sp.]|nr:nuclear transport factor 2 family protein [Halioglobus sp.]